MKPTLSYCADEVYRHDRDHFLPCLFLPAAQREVFFCFYALNIELVRVHDMVSEEMIGHIRYAWWQEAVEEIYSGGKAKGQPVLQALEQLRIPREFIMPLVESYREHFPLLPPDNVDISLPLMRALCPEAEKSWRKAGYIITTHRKRYGKKRNAWLAVKLIININ